MRWGVEIVLLKFCSSKKHTHEIIWCHRVVQREMHLFTGYLFLCRKGCSNRLINPQLSFWFRNWYLYYQYVCSVLTAIYNIQCWLITIYRNLLHFSSSSSSSSSYTLFRANQSNLRYSFRIKNQHTQCYTIIWWINGLIRSNCL